MIILVSYDLKVPGRDYSRLYDVLRTADNWWHFLESTWVLSTRDTVQVWSNRIQGVIDPNDRFIVVDITDKPRNGWLPKNAWEWLNANDHA